jgi:hypothetical protein
LESYYLCNTILGKRSANIQLGFHLLGNVAQGLEFNAIEAVTYRIDPVRDEWEALPPVGSKRVSETNTDNVAFIFQLAL